MVRVDENGYPVTYEARGLAENQMYEFWVSASTSVGEGEPTSVVAQATNTRGKCVRVYVGVTGYAVRSTTSPLIDGSVSTLMQ